MNQRRIEDIFLGVTMVVIGITPLGLALSGQGHLLADYGFGAVSENLTTVLVMVFVVCGLVLAGAGVNVVRNGRAESSTPSLY